MCGRYVLAQDYEELKQRFGLEQSDIPIQPRYNIAPQQQNPVIVKNHGKSLKMMKWGLVPHWAKDPSIGNKMINARAETVHEKPSFREPLKKSRCLVPATGFYEWQKDPLNPKRKTPVFVNLEGDGLFAFAGLWSIWEKDDDTINSYTILTTEPNELMKTIHNRMPVILKPDDEEKWLHPEASTEELLKLLRPYPPHKMAAYPVSTFVNKPMNDSEECIKPVDDVK